MKVKIGNEIYNAVDQPIMIIFDSQGEKDAIGSMSPDNMQFCLYDSNKHTEEEIDEWMALEEPELSRLIEENYNELLEILGE